MQFPKVLENHEMATVTATVLTKNEEKNIAACIQSLQWADVVQVVDTGSTDKTIEIAKANGAEVIEIEWPGFTKAREKQFSLTQTEWTFWIDADERCSPELGKEVKEKLSSGHPYPSYSAPRLTYFYGRPVHHCGWYPDRMPRLFRSINGFSHAGPHSKILVDQPEGELQGVIHHYQSHEFKMYVAKMADYAKETAAYKYEKGRRCGLLSCAAIGPLKFFKVWILKGGILDGWVGLEISLLAGISDTLKYVALYRLSHGRNDT